MDVHKLAESAKDTFSKPKVKRILAIEAAIVVAVWLLVFFTGGPSHLIGS